MKLDNKIAYTTRSTVLLMLCNREISQLYLLHLMENLYSASIEKELDLNNR